MKRGSMFDLLAVMLIFFAAVLVFFISTAVITEFNSAANRTLWGTVGGYNASVIMSNGANATVAMNSMIPFLVLMSGLTALLLAYFIPSHPIFLPISILLLIIFTFTATIFSDTLWTFIHAPKIMDVANQYPIVVGIINYLPHLIAILGVLMIIVMHGRTVSTGELA